MTPADDGARIVGRTHARDRGRASCICARRLIARASRAAAHKILDIGRVFGPNEERRLEEAASTRIMIPRRRLG